MRPRTRWSTRGAAVELIHAYSLVHDDLPCMDDDVLRRGKPTCHVAFDEATALLVGDSLQSLAFQVLSEHRAGRRCRSVSSRWCSCSPRRPARAAWRAGRRSISPASAQELSVPELELMHIHKTGALIRAAVWLGASCGEPLPSRARTHTLDRFAKFVGLAFQVVDDVLDVQADTATLGKTAGKDAQHNKPTYVSVLGLVARARAARRSCARRHWSALGAARSTARSACASSPTSSFCGQSSACTSCSIPSQVPPSCVSSTASFAAPGGRAAAVSARVGSRAPAGICRPISARSS